MSSGKWRPFCLGLNVLIWIHPLQQHNAKKTDKSALFDRNQKYTGKSCANTSNLTDPLPHCTITLTHHSNHLVNVKALKLYRTNIQIWTRITRTPAFWGYPLPPHDYTYHWFILDPKSKQRRQRFKKFAKTSNFLILKKKIHVTHHLKLLAKICKYEMDPMSIAEDTEWTRFLSTDGLTDKAKPIYPPFNFVEAGV